MAWTTQGILDEVIAAPRSEFAPLPDMRVIRSPEWIQIITPSFKQGGLNEVHLAVLADSEVDAVITRTIAEYQGSVFRWTVGPDSRPLDLGERLEKHGFVKSEVVGVYKTIEDEPALEVTRVTPDQLDEYIDVLARGWEVDPAPFGAHARVLIADQKHRLFVARDEEGRAIGAASTILFPRSAYLVGAVVLPEHRKRGAYRSLVRARIVDAAREGRTLATCHARAETSAPALKKLGFTEACRFFTYRLKTRSKS